MVKIVESGIISKNPVPQLKAEQAVFPGLVQLSEREFLCCYRKASAGEAVDARYALTRSLDGGSTWQEEGLLWDPSKDERTYSYGYGYPSLLANGTLILSGYRWDRSVPERPIVYNPKTLGGVPCDTLLFRSADMGHTWSPPQVVPLPDGLIGNASGRVVPLSDGRLLLPVETWKAYEDPAPPRQRSLALFSADGGLTWPEYSVAAMDPKHRLLYWNGMFSRMCDGRILVMYWVKDYETGEDLPIRGTYSEDDGKSWAEPFDTGIVGQMGSVVDLGDGRAFAAYNRRDARNPGVYGTISEDGGKTWPQDGHLCIWDARGRAQIGSSEQEECGLFDESLFAFGKPDVHRLPDGAVYVAHWATHNFVTFIRWVRVSVGQRISAGGRDANRESARNPLKVCAPSA